jgi:serpin B
MKIILFLFPLLRATFCTNEGLSQAISDFTMDFYGKLAESEQYQERNFVFSPLSLHSAMTFLYLGATADSQTYVELRESMGILTDPMDILTKYNNITTFYNNKTNFQYGNRLWMSEEFDIKDKFNDAMKQYLDVDATLVNFTDDVTVDEVNEWVSNITEGKISELVQDFSDNTMMYIANALHFKEKWFVPFEDAVDKDFYAINTQGSAERVDAEMMTAESESLFRYGRLKTRRRRDVEVVTLPYADEGFEMRIILPDEKQRNALTILEHEMVDGKGRWGEEEVFNPFFLNYIDVNGDNLNLTVNMPAFGINSKIDAADVLRAMGVTAIFSDAELGVLTSSRLAVSQIVHKAVVDVNKNGTEGAAATGIGLVLHSGGPTRVKTVNVNRPFIFVIHDVINNIPVLVGRVLDPREL